MVYRYPISFQPGQDMVKIDIFEYDKSATENNISLGSILGNAIGDPYSAPTKQKDKDGNPITRIQQNDELNKLNIHLQQHKLS